MIAVNYIISYALKQYSLSNDETTDVFHRVCFDQLIESIQKVQPVTYQ